MNRVTKYVGVSWMSLASLISSCKYIGSSEPPKIEDIDEQRNKREIDPVRKEILDFIYADFGNAVLDLLTHGNIDWFIKNGFFDPNLKGKNGKDLRPIERCIFAFEFYPPWSMLNEENKSKFHPVTATAFLDNNLQSTLFKGDKYALSHLEDMVIVDLNDLFNANQRNSEIYPLILRRNAQGKYEVYSNPGMKEHYHQLIKSFIDKDTIRKGNLYLLQPELCKGI